MDKLYRICPVCNNDKVIKLHNQMFELPEGAVLPKSYDIVVCSKCGLAYANTSASQENYNEYYEKMSKYDDEIVGTGGGNNESDKKRLKSVSKRIEKYVNDKEAKILDIGCGNGAVLKYLKDDGYTNLLGLDPSKKSIEKLHTIGLKGVQGNILDYKGIYNFYKNFECIILSGVLEHILDLQGALNNILKMIDEEGILYIEVPDASRYDEHYSVPFYYFDIEHINHFDEDTLDTLIIAFGFEKVVSDEVDYKVSSDFSYPCIYAVYKKVKSSLYNINKSLKTEKSIKNYISMSYKDERYKIFEYYKESNKPIVVWGAGMYTYRMLSESDLKYCNIKAFIDNDSKKQGKLLNNISIYTSDYLKEFDGDVLLCTAYNNDEIYRQIKKEGYKNNIIKL